MKWPAALTLCLAWPVWATDLTGQLDWSQRVELSTPVSGLVDKVLVQPGQTVKKGDLLLALDAAVFKANLLEARSEVDRLVEEEADAQKDLERATELYARTVSSTTELDAAKLRLARASAQLAGARARQERARALLAQSEVRAPFDAVILERRAEPGMAVAGQCQPPSLLTVARADEIVARAPLPAERITQAGLGGQISVLVQGRAYPATLRAVQARSDGQYSVEAVFSRPSSLMGGLPATLRLP